MSSSFLFATVGLHFPCLKQELFFDTALNSMPSSNPPHLVRFVSAFVLVGSRQKGGLRARIGSKIAELFSMF